MEESMLIQGAGGHLLVLVIGLILMILAPIFARLIYFAVSRKREYLADASSAQYTRYPEGLASALAGAGAVEIRGAVLEPGKMERVRETSDLMWRMNNYKTINCDCGTKLKVPPKFKKANVKCPRCGHINPL